MCAMRGTIRLISDGDLSPVFLLAVAGTNIHALMELAAA